jgi:hypothetical protein
MSAPAPEHGGRALAGRPDQFQPVSCCRIPKPTESLDELGTLRDQAGRFVEVTTPGSLY